jgi:multiple sugar transport system substrate-binding protein
MSAMGGMGTSDLFVNGTSAMFLSGIWKTPTFRQQIKDFKWDVAMFPKGPTGVRAFGTGGSGYGILKTSGHKAEAWKLIKFISGENGAKRIAQTGLAQPAMQSVAAGPDFLDGKDPQNKKMLLEAVKYVKYMPMAKNSQEIQNGVIVPVLDKVWSGTINAQQAADLLKPQLAKQPPLTK